MTVFKDAGDDTTEMDDIPEILEASPKEFGSYVEEGYDSRINAPETEYQNSRV